MKKILYFLSMLALISMMPACTNRNAEALRKSIEAYNEKCPVNMGIMGELTGVEYDEATNTVAYNALLNDNVVGVSIFRDNEASFRKQLKMGFSQDEAKELIELTANAGASLKCKYTNRSDGDTFSIELSNADLKDILEHPVSDNDRHSTTLEIQVAIGNSACPMAVGNGMTMVSLTDDGTSVVNLYDVDEDIVDLGLLEANSAEMKENMKSFFYDPSMKTYLQAMVALNRNYVYRYKGTTTGRIVEITFTPQEIPAL